MSRHIAVSVYAATLVLFASLGCSGTNKSINSAPNAGALTASPASLSFAASAPDTSVQETVVVKNAGNSSIAVQGISVAGSSAFSIVKDSLPQSLEPGQSSDVVIAFKPPANGNFSGSVVVSAGSADSIAIPLAGSTGAQVSVSLTPSQVTLQVGGTQQFAVTVGGTTNQNVTWYVDNIKGGNASVGTVDASGLYTAPLSLPSGETVSVSAVSVADTTKSASASISIVANASPVAVSISPTSAVVQGNMTQQFTAQIAGTSNTSVKWLVNGTIGGSGTLGTISSNGLYMAPPCPASGTVTVTAQSAYDTSSSASATVSLTPASSTSNDRYVATTGSDSNDGSACHPWATVQYAASLAQPGWTIHVAPGTYDVGAGIVNDNSGTANSPIVYIGSYDKSTWTWNTKLVSTGSAVWTTSANYVDIVGFDLTSTDASATWGFHIGGSDISIKDNYVHDIYSDSPGAGIMLGSGTTATGNLVEGNVVAREAHTAGGSTDNQCIYTTESYTTIVNNIVFGCHKYGIQIYSNIAGGSNYNVIANNTVFASYRGIVVGGQDTGSGAPTVDYNIITNNIVYGITDIGLNAAVIFGSHNITSNNLTYNDGTNYSSSYTNHTNDIVADPLFVNYAPDGTGDYQLQPASPCRDAGTNVGAPKYDFLYVSRPQGSAVDCGAYEFVP